LALASLGDIFGISPITGINGPGFPDLGLASSSIWREAIASSAIAFCCAGVMIDP
jgi:hypothetical protein